MRRHAPTLAGLFLAVLASVLLHPDAASAAVPPDFEDSLVTKVGGPTALAFAPDGDMLITSHFGKLHVFENGVLLTALDISAKICSDKERGLLGVAVDPSFATNRYVYLYYTFKKHGVCEYNTSRAPVNRVSRFVLASNNTVDPATEVVLIDNMPNPGGIHAAGDLFFGKDGYLYVSVGDGGCDLDDGTVCGSRNDNARQSHILIGKILRVTRDGGIPPSNPFQGTDSARCNVTGRTDPGKQCQETYASGLRNPFRFAFDPNATGTRFFINDVGQATWEEVDEGLAGADYGWNVREGHCARSSTTDCGPPPAGMTNPVYDYQHNTITPTGSTSTCNAITGGAFVPNGVWPASYNGSYLYGDFTCGTIFRLTPAAGGGFTRSEFLTGLGGESAVVLAFGPDGAGKALYYTTYNLGGQIRRVRYTGSTNRPPTAVASANPTYGAVPLTVNFDGTGSGDPDGDALRYDWNFGDGSAHATTATASHTYGSAGTYTATLTVSDGKGGSSSKSLRIDAGETPPTARITSPSASKLFRVGETITLQGSASDAQDGTLPDTSLSWRVVLHHATHTHPFLPPTSGNNISFTAPTPEDLLAATNSYLEIELTATDSRGLTSVVTQALNPNKVDVAFLTEPEGLRVEVNATTVTGPQTITSWEAYRLDVSAPAQTDSTGATWVFRSWSDGGAAAHSIFTPATASSYKATFEQAATFAPEADARVQEANPTTNYGSSAYLRADAGADPDVESYLRFAVSGVTGSVARATLRLFEYNGTGDGPAVYATSNSWSETGITWSNRPARTGAAADDKGRIPANSWVEYDVTSLVTGNGTYSFNLATTSSDASYVYSKENPTNRPQLVVIGGGSPTTLNVDAAADARVEEASPSLNFGASGYLAVDGGADPDKEAYLRFSVSGASGTIVSAKLRLYVYNGSANGPAVYSTSNTWTETGITWSNRPARTSAATDDKGSVPAGAWVEYDVKPFVTGDGTYSFVLATTSSDALYVYSRNHTDPALRPRLVITTSGG